MGIATDRQRIHHITIEIKNINPPAKLYNFYFRRLEGYLNYNYTSSNDFQDVSIVQYNSSRFPQKPGLKQPEKIHSKSA